MLDILGRIGRALELAVGWIFSPHWLPPADFQFYKWLIVPGFGYGFVLIGLGILELVMPAQKRPWNKRSLLSGTYLVLTGKLGFYAFFVVPAVRKVWLALELPSAHLDRLLPLWLYMPLGVLVVTFFAYWCHRLMHRIPLLWNIHKIHHSVENLNCTSIYHRHFLEDLLQTPVHLVTTLLLGTDLVSPFGIIFKVIDVLGHSNVNIKLGRLSYLVSTPEAHRIHHSMEPRHYDSNFGNTFMIWDQLFGTFKYDPEHPPTRFGVDENIPVSFFKQQWLPLVWIGSKLRGRPAVTRLPAQPGITEGA